MSLLEVRCAPSPFLKWAGGKRALVSQILPRFPSSFGTYFEPFIGAGALFFSLPSATPKVGNDFNGELINAYEAIRDDVEAVLRELRKQVNSREHYLSVRAWDRSPHFNRRSRASRAARFIYLNKCGFNGLYRVNSQGHYNVPYGNSPRADFIQEDNLRAVSEFLNARAHRRSLVRLENLDYRESLKRAKAGDFVYLDPPYDPVSPTASFVSYSENGFGKPDQVQLRDELLDLNARGVSVLLSNSDTPFIRGLYASSAFNIETVEVRRAISAKSSSRGMITEVLISNYRR